ncbi:MULTISPECIES: hypothetical protein [unclassified Rhodococcus (in: high G+C Gram-positive bacteria)]|uniref:hypothetical protein n=1 Tax=unclassified Rhodococcus (in: high G+C Gram-positive bacteria) TaxID=192944 RepID=UPI00068CDDE0|nr:MULTISPECIES: hypothetical protein [unclassified Rhodococcus (in: high G+C Gram-positive bacteria)]AOD23842.1 hypothetical protein IM25_21515 [Rhodococcus sp. p52]
MTEQHHQPSLRDLINRAAEVRDATGRRLAELAQKQGYDLTHTTVNKIRARTYKSQPSDDTIRAIAWLAGVDEEVAYAAAGRRTPLAPFVDDLPPGVDYLNAKEREAVVELLRVMVSQRLALDDVKDEDLNAGGQVLSLVGHSKEEDDEDFDGELFDPEQLAARKGKTLAEREDENSHDDM